MFQIETSNFSNPAIKGNKNRLLEAFFSVKLLIRKGTRKHILINIISNWIQAPLLMRKAARRFPSVKPKDNPILVDIQSPNAPINRVKNADF